MQNVYFNPGCALSLYKPEMEEKMIDILKSKYPSIKMHKICCNFEPKVEPDSLIINVCAGCDRRFSSLYEGVSTISFWEVLDGFDYPWKDYGRIELSVHDPCPIREKKQVHTAVRSLLGKMNICINEAEKHGTSSVCCGDSLYPSQPMEKVEEAMIKRAQTMPCEQVCVYCVSCIQSMHIGGKKPRYLLDLIFEQPTSPQPFGTAEWHEKLAEYKDNHKQ